MPLPIIIIPERHWDSAPKEVVSQKVKELRELGYSTLCFESPMDDSEDDLIAGVGSTVEFTENRLAEAKPFLEKAGIALQTALSQDYSVLATMLRTFVSSKYSKEMALWFKELPGHKAKLDLISLARKESIHIRGIDLRKSELEPLRNIKAQADISAKLTQIDELDDARCLSFVTNMIRLQNAGQGIIFIVGQSHIKKISALMSDKLMNDEVIYFHPYSKCFLDSSMPDTHMGLEDIDEIELINVQLENNKGAITEAANCLLENIHLKVPKMYREISPTSSTERLREFTKLPFTAYARPSLSVDCLIPFSKDAVEPISKLNANKVFGRFGFFNSTLVYCVPNVNHQEVAEKLHKL